MIELRSRRARWLFGFFLVAAVVVAYWPSLHGGFVMDDDNHIAKNEMLHSIYGLQQIWTTPGATCQYYPLTFSWFWMDFHLWGLNTLGYHLQNVLLHACVALLLWQVLTSLKVRGAALAAVIFALHPVTVMTVAWMTELKNTLSCSLILAAAWAYIRYARLGIYESDTRSASPVRYYVLAMLFFMLGMFAKTAVSFLPVTLLMITWWQRPRLTRRDMLGILPFFLIAVGMGRLTIYVEQHSGGASGNEFTLGFLERILVSGRSFWFYLGKLIFPFNLAFIYPRWKLDVTAWWQYLFPLATVSLFAALWLLRRRVGKAPFAAAMHFYVSTSLLVLFVVLFFTRYAYVSDHWQYFGCLSIISLGAAGIAALWHRAAAQAKRVISMGVAAWLVTLGALTWRQCEMYDDVETLWRGSLDRNPDAWVAHYNLAGILLDSDRLDEALVHVQRGLEINPHVRGAQANLAAVLERMGREDEAFDHLQHALQMDETDPDSHASLGAMLLKRGRVDEAIAHLKKAVELDPDYVEAYSNLGDALQQSGLTNESLAPLQMAIKIAPDYTPAQYNIANSLLTLGRPAEALTHLQRLLDVTPNDADALNNMAWILATSPDSKLRNGTRAVELAERSDRIAGGENPIVAGTLAAAYAEAGRFDDAVGAGEKAVQLAMTAGDEGLAESFRHEIALYRARSPLREKRR